MRGRSAISGAMVLALVPLQAEAMTVDAFLTKARALQAKGMLAAASPDLAEVRGEITTAAQAYRAQVEADRVAGKPPRSCPPPRGKANVDARTLIADFAALPPVDRSQSVTAAFQAMMQQRYPCG